MRFYENEIRKTIDQLDNVVLGGSVVAMEDRGKLADFIVSLLPEKRIVRHLARGSSYDVFLESASVQCKEPIQEGDVVVVYVEDGGTGWVRPVQEFNDGRFETLRKPDQA